MGLDVINIQLRAEIAFDCASLWQEGKMIILCYSPHVWLHFLFTEGE